MRDRTGREERSDDCILHSAITNNRLSSARVCDMSRMADEVETLRGKIEMSEDGRTKLWDELEKGRRKVSKLKERERSFTKSGREAKELGEMAVREAERTMEKARRAVVRNRRPLVNAKRVAYR